MPFRERIKTNRRLFAPFHAFIGSECNKRIECLLERIRRKGRFFTLPEHKIRGNSMPF